MKNQVKMPAYLILGITASIVLSLFIVSITLPVETQAQDPSQMNFTVGNAAPTVGAVTCDHNTISEATDYIAWCYATVTDTNGYQDVVSCNGTFYRTSAGLPGAENKNVRYGNNSCTLFGGTGNTVTCNCSYLMKYYADGGVGWTGKITAIDASAATGNAEGVITGDTLDSTLAIALPVSSVLWGTLTVGTSTTFNANDITRANNTGNVNLTISAQSATATMTCAPSPANVTCGQIKAWNQTGAYAAGGLALTTGSQNLLTSGMDDMWADNLQDGAPATVENRTVYWAISVPTGVNGTCTITVNQLASAALSGT
jgi:hypothetical protein